jgi:hypothetical protein
MSARSKALLSKAADALSELRDPFSTDWLVENEVTLDECGDLSEHIGTIIKGYLAAPSDVRERVALAGAFSGSSVDPKIAAVADNSLVMSQTARKLKAIKVK